jgi:hypothetical protein
MVVIMILTNKIVKLAVGKEKTFMIVGACSKCPQLPL